MAAPGKPRKRQTQRGYCIDIPLKWLNGDPRFHALGPDGQWVLLHSMAWCHVHDSDGDVPFSAERWITYTEGVRVPQKTLAKLLAQDYAEVVPGGWRLLRWGEPVENGGLEQETVAEKRKRLDGWAAAKRGQREAERATDHDEPNDLEHANLLVSDSGAGDVSTRHSEDSREESRVESSECHGKGIGEVNVTATASGLGLGASEAAWPLVTTAAVPHPHAPLDDALPPEVEAEIAALGEQR